MSGHRGLVDVSGSVDSQRSTENNQEKRKDTNRVGRNCNRVGNCNSIGLLFLQPFSSLRIYCSK